MTLTPLPPDRRPSSCGGADGTLLQTLSKANIDALKELKWKPPEEFVVKAADGETDLYGILYKPYDFEPGKKYPVIECIYAGPQRREVPHDFIYFNHAGNRGIRVGDWKLVAEGGTGPWELYDLRTDRSESINLAERHPHRARRLARGLLAGLYLC